MHTNIVLKNVDRIKKNGSNVYKAVIDLETLYNNLRFNMIQYSPRYQRGFNNDDSDLDYDNLFTISNPNLNINITRANEMAAKTLMGSMRDVTLTWNIRNYEGIEPPKYNELNRTLEIHNILTLPDSGHRHKAYYLLALWKKKPSKIPNSIKINGDIITKDQLTKMLSTYILKEEEFFVEIYNLDEKGEGEVFDERNTNAKKPSPSSSIRASFDKTPERRFLQDLMRQSKIFTEDELEQSSSSIGSKSRKLTTLSTLEKAIEKSSLQISKYEHDHELYNNLVRFTSTFFEEWSLYFNEYKPSATAEERWESRRTSFALQNIIFHPLFEIAFTIWEAYHNKNINWTKNTDWKSLLATIEPKMHRDNPDWKGVVLTKTIIKSGEESWIISNNFNTRRSVYEYLKNICKLDNFIADLHL